MTRNELIQSRNNLLVVLIRTTNLIGHSYFVTVLWVSWKYNRNDGHVRVPAESSGVEFYSYANFFFCLHCNI